MRFSYNCGAISVLLFVLGSTQAFAQGVAFTTTSLPRQMRQEGITETAGDVVLTAINSGTIPAGSTISAVFSTAITNNSTASTNNISLANNVSCSNVNACPTSASLIGTSTVRLNFASAKSFTIGDGVYISRVRVNANSAIGIGSITVTFSGSSTDPANFPISFTDPQRQVGVLNPTVSVNFNHSSATAFPVTGFQTCAFPNDNVNDFFVRVNEVFPGALTTLAQETVVSPNLAPTNGVLITIAITNVPAGLTLEYTGTQLTTGLLAVTAPTPSSSVDQLVGGTTIFFTFALSAADTSQVERTTFNFSLRPTSGNSIASVVNPVNVQGTVQVTPATSTDSIILRFASNAIGPTTLATIADCFIPSVPQVQITSE